MVQRVGVAVAVLSCAAGVVRAANIYIISSGDPLTDQAAAAALTSRGHTATIGVTYDLFDGTVSLSGYQTVYLQNNYNWTAAPVMPSAGAQQLTSWVNGGGRLVTSEWVVYYTAPTYRFGELGPIIPAEQTYSYGSQPSATYTVATPDAPINAGVASPFTCTLTSYTGTETFAVAKAGATTYYTTSNSATAAALVGWGVGAGSVFSFLSTCGPDQLSDANFGRLFSNVMGAGGTAPCYPNCDGSTAAPILNVLDFNCFLNRFSAGDAYANCDGSTAPPVLNVLDFNCFLNRFSAGCP
jgi:hypothetical protein